MRESGLADLLPSLSEMVWVGLSAGSMVMTPRIGEDFVGWKPPTGGDSTLGIVNFSIFPNLDHELLPENSMADAERWAAEIHGPAYAIDDERWVPLVRETDVLLVAGGDAVYLCHWMRQSGLADLLPSLHETVWVGLSAGSMVMTPCIGEDFVGWKPPTGGDRTLGIVDFSICPHLAQENMPGNSMAEAEQWAAGIPGPAYAIDDQTAIRVTDGTVEVVSEGHWKLFTP
jgi:peptidase E